MYKRVATLGRRITAKGAWGSLQFLEIPNAVFVVARFPTLPLQAGLVGGINFSPAALAAGATLMRGGMAIGQQTHHKWELTIPQTRHCQSRPRSLCCNGETRN